MNMDLEISLTNLFNEKHIKSITADNDLILTVTNNYFYFIILFIY